MKYRWLFLFAAVALIGVGCGEGSHDPVSSSSLIEPAERRATSGAVAGTCETPHCRPGFTRTPLTLSATLGRDQSVPAIPNSGGTATFSLNADSTQLTYEIRVQGIPSVSSAHFHNAPAGSNGGVVRTLSGDIVDSEWVSSGVWSSDEADQPLTATLLSEVLAGNIYINVHTEDYGPGEVRGQIVSGDSGLTATLDRSQAGNPVSGGTGTFTLSADRTSLTYEISVVGVPNVTAAHLHNAAAGSNGGVVRSLSGSIVDGAWVSAGVWTASDDTQPLTLDAVRLLVTRQIYINVHTADYGPGEVRGQVLR
ncbi:MAG: CHRD domain-containing protein [Gemmatimonadetes bacterium]|jgi:hypothetical protein|nr:CHRD domain-containing protein [Gemmatimonadota bacterium]MBT5146689.1 CHRD domain-containing protein [Gemmatimonadota bacterium]MBT5587889.1 CHRD domain-containing protein [Gemmatimonadota bacterium]MBT5964633.1 CHRD domain-containing protein [Gemmatimonadota bacterium]MBT7455931.1 CHRD domain-containing protein [Gemmatimonadota bacterium]